MNYTAVYTIVHGIMEWKACKSWNYISAFRTSFATYKLLSATINKILNLSKHSGFFFFGYLKKNATYLIRFLAKETYKTNWYLEFKDS